MQCLVYAASLSCSLPLCGFPSTELSFTRCPFNMMSLIQGVSFTHCSFHSVFHFKGFPFYALFSLRSAPLTRFPFNTVPLLRCVPSHNEIFTL